MYVHIYIIIRDTPSNKKNIPSSAKKNKFEMRANLTELENFIQCLINNK